MLTGCATANKSADKRKKEPAVAFNKVKFDSYFLEGLKQKTLGNDEQAARQFAKALMLNSTHPATLYELANLEARNGDMPAATEHMSVALKGEPKNRYYREFAASLYQQQAKYDEAAQVYESLVLDYPEMPEYYFELSSAYLYGNQPAKAAATYDSLEVHAGFNPEVSVQKVRIYGQLGETDKAKREIEKLIKNSPDEVQYYGMLAKLYRQDGETDKAIAIYEQLLEKNPEDPYIHLSLYEFYLETGETEKANKALYTAFENPNLGIDNKIQVLINYYRATEQDRSEMPRVYELLDVLVKAHPGDAKGFAMYGDFLYRDQKLKEARERYYASISKDDSKYLIWNQVLFINSELQDNAAMIKDSEQAMDLFPNQPIVYLFNGMAHLQNEDYEKAAFALEQGQGLVIDNPTMQNQFFANLGDAYYRLGKYRQAWMNYERSLKVNPQNDYVLNNYAYYLSLRNENLEYAAEMAASVVKRNPTDPTYLDTYGWALFQLEDYANAQLYLEKALENGGSSGEILEHLADTYFKLGRIDDAVLFWQQALKAGGGSDRLEQKINSKSYVK